MSLEKIFESFIVYVLEIFKQKYFKYYILINLFNYINLSMALLYV